MSEKKYIIHASIHNGSLTNCNLISLSLSLSLSLMQGKA